MAILCCSELQSVALCSRRFWVEREASRHYIVLQQVAASCSV